MVMLKKLIGFASDLSDLPGGLAQLGEHLLCKQGVVGSIPSTSTKTSNLSQSHGNAMSDLGLIF
jgi:hypothetical protein